MDKLITLQADDVVIAHPITHPIRQKMALLP